MFGFSFIRLCETEDRSSEGGWGASLRPAAEGNLNKLGECSNFVVGSKRPAGVTISVTVARPARSYPDGTRKAEISLGVADHEVIGAWAVAEETYDAPIEDIGVRLGGLTRLVCEDLANAVGQPKSSKRHVYRRTPFIAQHHDTDARVM
jgi:hypothetical protein